MLTLYGDSRSGNDYKARLAMAHLGVPFRYIEKDIMQGETRTAEFLAMNPNGRIPLLRTEDGTHLAESNAILWYLAEGTELLPPGRLARAQVLQWMFFEQYSHEPYIAVLKFWRKFMGLTPADKPDWKEREQKGYAALGVMETHLSQATFFVENRFTIADIALYAYTHAAEEGGYVLRDYGAVRAWLARVAGQPGHQPITWTGPESWIKPVA